MLPTVRSGPCPETCIRDVVIASSALGETIQEPIIGRDLRDYHGRGRRLRPLARFKYGFTPYCLATICMRA